MSDSPEKSQHPWSKYYAQRGATRPQLTALTPSSGARGARDAKGAGAAPAAAANRKPSEVSAELAAAVAAATAAAPSPTIPPFLKLVQQKQTERELQRRLIRRWSVRVAIAAGVLMLLHLMVTRIVYRAPSDAALQQFGDALMRSLVPLHSTERQPLVPRGVGISLTDQISADRLRYSAEVSLQLAQPLYLPATSNGSTAYRQMQESLQLARELNFKLKLFGSDVSDPPEMPLLLQVSHRAGEALTIRVPFQARRFGWTWRIEPAVLALRTTSGAFEGMILNHFAGTPHLVFGTPNAVAEMRSRIQLARSYVLAVNRAAQARAEAAARQAPLGNAIADQAAITPAEGAGSLLNRAGGPDPAIDSLPAAARNAPAIPLAADPNAPAVDPNAPAAPAPVPPPPR